MREELRLKKTYEFFDWVHHEATSARKKYDPFHSSHEAYAVMLEELDEFRSYVNKSKKKTVPQKASKELIQLSAMALCAYLEIIEPSS